MNSVDIYKDLGISGFIFPHDFKFPTNQKVVPTEIDYRKGFVKRTFCLFIGSGKIVEIPSTKINRYTSNYFIKTKTVKWVISGPQRNVYKNNILFEKGVYEQNVETLQLLKFVGFENIENFLNPLDLYKN